MHHVLKTGGLVVFCAKNIFEGFLDFSEVFKDLVAQTFWYRCLLDNLNQVFGRCCSGTCAICFGHGHENKHDFNHCCHRLVAQKHVCEGLLWWISDSLLFVLITAMLRKCSVWRGIETIRAHCWTQVVYCLQHGSVIKLICLQMRCECVLDVVPSIVTQQWFNNKFQTMISD